MEFGNFYFLKDDYLDKFNTDGKLMKNKEKVGDKLVSRPCHYAFKDNHTGLYWLIPISSKVEKFKKLYSGKIKKYGFCDTIVFGELLGYEKAFLIQNMCPTTIEYVDNLYVQGEVPVKVDGVLEKELVTKANKVLALHRKGIKLIFPDVLSIEKSLIAETED